jgi:hypothetical protein
LPPNGNTRRTFTPLNPVPKSVGATRIRTTGGTLFIYARPWIPPNTIIGPVTNTLSQASSLQQVQLKLQNKLSAPIWLLCEQLLRQSRAPATTANRDMKSETHVAHDRKTDKENRFRSVSLASCLAVRLCAQKRFESRLTTEHIGKRIQEQTTRSYKVLHLEVTIFCD